MNLTVSLLGADALTRLPADRLVAPLLAAIERELAHLPSNATPAERESALAEAVARLRVSPRTQQTA